MVAYLRRLLGQRRIGHGGTLDPGASGVLPILVGRATRLSDYMLDYDKTYATELTLGIATSTQDASGETTGMKTDFTVSPRQLADVLASFQGPIWQTPPMASAVRVGGKRLYELGRRGLEVQRQPRKVHIHSINIMAIWHEGEKLGFGTRVLLKITVPRVYRPDLCHDIGEKIWCRRPQCPSSPDERGPFHRPCFHLGGDRGLADKAELTSSAMQSALPTGCKVHPLVEERVKNGSFILPEHLLDVPTTLTVGEEVILLSLEGEMLALAEIKKTDSLICHPFRVFGK